MKIQCNYCKAMFDDTNAACPYCGANNPGVVRTAADQPVTIAQLQQWYKDRGLPPYETTRFFIGVDYRQPRAFGIYQDPQTGNFVVYKNKDNGARAVRYQGTDEAYAVNELFQRLKEEILQQKSMNLQKGRPLNGAPPPSYPGRPYGRPAGGRHGGGSVFPKILIFIGFILFFAMSAFGTRFLDDEPKTGYYDYQGDMAYYLNYYDAAMYGGWFFYDTKNAEWEEPVYLSDAPEELQSSKTANSYYVQKNWDASLGVPDVTQSLAYKDSESNYSVSTGYYNYDGTNYYHLGYDRNDGWYAYDPDLNYWYETSDYYVPDDLKHDSLANDFYYTPTWDSDTQITDFEDTDYYADYSSTYNNNTYDSYDSNSSSSDWSSDWSSSSSDYSWDSGSSWDSGGSDWGSDW